MVSLPQVVLLIMIKMRLMLKHRHPERDLLHVSDDMPPSLAYDSTSVLNALKTFQEVPAQGFTT